MVKKFNINWKLVIILFLGFAISFYMIGEVPPGMSHDELEYVNNGYSIYKTGKDLYGDFLPLSIGGVGYVAIPAYVAGLPTVFLGLSETSVRLMPVIFSILELMFIYGIAKILFKSEKVALFASLILALSVWRIMISREMLDSPTALFFYLLGIFLFLRAKGIKGIILALVSLFVGCISYYGAFFIHPFVILALIIYRWDLLRTMKKQFFISGAVIACIFGLIVGFMLFQQGQNTRSLGRSSELIILNVTNIVDNVIYHRSNSASIEFFNKLFVNKATYIWSKFFSNYFGAFSPRMIFVEGDPNVIYGLWGRGEFSILDFPLVLIGIFYLLKRSKRGLLLVAAFIFIAPITSGLTGQVYATRSFLFWPFLAILAGGGMALFWEWAGGGGIKKKIWKKIILFVFLSFYTFFFFARMHQYFFRYPIYAKEAWFDSEKQAALYLLAHKDEKITIYALEGRQMFMEYFFFSKMDPIVAQLALSKDNIRADIRIGNFTFVNGCRDPGNDPIDHKVMVQTRCVPLNLDLADQKIFTRDGSNAVKWGIFTKSGIEKLNKVKN